MTHAIKQLQRDLGYLAATIANLEATRQLWSVAEKTNALPAAQHDLTEDFLYGFAEANIARPVQTPQLLYGLCLVRAYSIFETYLRDLVTAIVTANPRVLLSQGKREDRKVEYREIVERLHSPEKMIVHLVEKELHRLTYAPTQTLLDSLRSGYGLSSLDKRYDKGIVEIALTRNCVVHNEGKADPRLVAASNGLHCRWAPEKGPVVGACGPF